MAGFKESVKPAVFDGSNYLSWQYTGHSFTEFNFSCVVKSLRDLGADEQAVGAGPFGLYKINSNSWACSIQYTDASAQGFFLDIEDTPQTGDVFNIYFTATKGGDAVIYINSEEKLRESLPDKDFNLRYPTSQIGWRGSSGNSFVGEISNVCIFTQALTPEQIKTLYGQGVGIPAKLLKTYGLDSGLLAGYDLHGDNPLVDLSGNGNHLANVNNVTFDGDAVDVVYQPLQTVVGAEFDGTNYLEADPNRTDSINKITVCCFIRTSDVTQRQDFFGRRGWCYLRFSGGNIGASLAMLNGASPSVGIPAENDRLYFVAGVYDSSLSSDRLKLYIDGELATASNNMSGDLKNDSYNIAIGALSGGLNLTTGEVHGGGIFEDALSPEDIKALYNRGVGVDLKKLPSRLKDSAVGLYPLDDLLDYSGNGNDLISVNNVALTATKQGQRLLDGIQPMTDFQAMFFDGDSTIESDSDPNAGAQTAITYTCLVKPTSSELMSLSGKYVSFGTSDWFDYNYLDVRTGEMRFHFRGSSVDNSNMLTVTHFDTNLISLNKLALISWSVSTDTGLAYLYINGKSVRTVSLPGLFGSLDSQGYELIVGNLHKSILGDAFVGDFSFFTSYNRLLSVAEHEKIWNKGNPIMPEVFHHYGLGDYVFALSANVGYMQIDLAGTTDMTLNGSLVKGAWYTTAYKTPQKRTAAMFDGVSYLASQNGAVGSPTNYTRCAMSAWFYVPPGSTGTEHILGMLGTTLGVGIVSDTDIEVRSLPSTGGSYSIQYTHSSNLRGEVWHIVCVVDLSDPIATERLYLNGVEVVTGNNIPSIESLGDTLYACRAYGSTTMDSGGRIWDSVFIEDDILTPEQISHLYNSGKGRDLSTLPTEYKDLAIGLYPLKEDGSDVSGNDNHMTEVGAITYDAIVTTDVAKQVYTTQT